MVGTGTLITRSEASPVDHLVVSGGIPAPVATPAPVTAAKKVEPGTRPRRTMPAASYVYWAQRVAVATSVSPRALAAYAAAQEASASSDPGCHLTWVTLAGIAHVESDNGLLGGGIQSSGRPELPIIGIALDGGPGVQAILDTDDGRVDGDPVWDRAVGPFQFLPQTWASWKADGDQDGHTDAQDVDDAALAAARYLCAEGRDLSSVQGWQDGVLSYNASAAYVADVLTAANAYAAAAS